MRQLLLPDGLEVGSVHIAKGDDFHYLFHVLRLKEGVEITGRDPRGTVFTLMLEKHLADSLVFRIIAGSWQPAGNATTLELFCCLPKPVKMDLIIRMATEVGVTRIIPVVSEFSVIRERDLSKLVERRERWEKIARSALEQSGRSTLPTVAPVISFAEIPASDPARELSILALETGKDTKTLHELLGGSVPSSIRIVVGPEGGISAREESALREKGFSAVGLGENILRTETAVVSLCATVTLLILEKDSWKTS